ncbi:hypothetical protein GCM10007160_35480 [Litchfieldella qijiaojingensis]|uniref:DUF4124 domain-containing protein n=1 Tax=Litchfieldella qijiaojingensis TaxID=980347 RepID=A0ABQ2Z522_9GAMM|nr:hypothetical protein GCM10007160_35480 [Halomonas qijiaojingensis]
MLAFGLGDVAHAQAPLYSWQDADGGRRVSDRPPPPEVVLELEIDRYDLPALTPRQPPGESPYRPLTPEVPREPAQPARPPSPDMVPSPSCVVIDRRLVYIQRLLRAGDTEPEGNRLRAERRELEKRYRLDCR